MHYKHSNQNCPVQKTLEIIGGKWHTIILHYLSQQPKRYGELKRLLPGTSEKMLIQSLKELEKNGLIIRTAQPTIPPRVDYALSDSGKTLMPIISAMGEWGRQYATSALADQADTSTTLMAKSTTQTFAAHVSVAM